MSFIDDAISRLLIPSDGGIHARLADIKLDFKISETEAIAHCYCVKLDGNGNPRWRDLVEYVADKIVDYSIPRKEREYAKNNPSTSKTLALRRKAKALFTELRTTGEGGEMLLYILAQDILKLPQLISKMSLKTSGNVHYHGVDGVHVKYDNSSNSLLLYWGESKMHAGVDGALKECFKSLKGFLLDTFSFSSTQERDLQLITGNITQSVDNPQLEDLLVRYFDKDDDLSNNIKYKGICFVGFDSTAYPTVPLTKTLDDIKLELQSEISSWCDTTKTAINKYPNLSKYEIHVFLIPFPSVQDFRDYFIETINS